MRNGIIKYRKKFRERIYGQRSKSKTKTAISHGYSIGKDGRKSWDYDE